MNTDPVTWNPRRELWETSQMDLFSDAPEPFSETFPTSGSMRNGRLYPRPPLEVVTDENDGFVLPTPQSNSVRASRRAMVQNQQWTHPALEQAIEIAQGILPREFRSWDEVPGRSGLLPTPRCSDGPKGSPNQHGSSGDLMLPSAVLRLQ